MNLLTMTNATKAAIITLTNATMFLLIAFGMSLTDIQQAAVGAFVNAVLGLWVALTYKDSSKRLPEGLEMSEDPPPAIVLEEENE